MRRPQFRSVVRVVAAAALTLAAVAAWRNATHSAALDLPASPLPGAMSQADTTTAEIEYFTQRANADPQGASDRARLAGLYLQRSRETGDFEDYRRAEALARASIAIRGNRNSHAYRMLAAALLTQHRFAEAKLAAEELVARFPEEPAHRALLGEIQLELGQYAEARATFRSLRREHEHMAVAPRLARYAEMTGDRSGEEAALRSAAHQARYRGDLPREQVAWFQLRLADHQVRYGELGAAVETIRIGLAEEPGDFRLVALLARIEALRGNWRAAIIQGDRLGDAADLRTLALLGDAHAALGDTVGAEWRYQQLEASVAERPEPFNRQWSQFRVEHGRELPAMVRLLRQESSERPDMLGFELLAWAEYQSGNLPAARAAITRALAVGTQEGTLYFRAGMIELASGNRDGARRHLRRALELNPRFHHLYADVARQALKQL